MLLVVLVMVFSINSAQDFAARIEDYHCWFFGKTIDFLKNLITKLDLKDVELVHNRDFDAGLWKKIRKEVADRKDKIDVWLNSRALELIQDPETDQVVGAIVERNHKRYFIHAKNGVVVSTGGFENNPQMQQDYLHIHKLTPLGTLYNRGDGVKMVQSVGAKMWHMSNYESLGIIPIFNRLSLEVVFRGHNQLDQFIR